MPAKYEHKRGQELAFSKNKIQFIRDINAIIKGFLDLEPPTITRATWFDIEGKQAFHARIFVRDTTRFVPTVLKTSEMTMLKTFEIGSITIHPQGYRIFTSVLQFTEDYLPERFDAIYVENVTFENGFNKFFERRGYTKLHNRADDPLPSYYKLNRNRKGTTNVA